MGDRTGELFIKSSRNLEMVGELSVIEGDWLVGGRRGFLPRKFSEKGPEV